jgi:hypothetical protein
MESLDQEVSKRYKTMPLEKIDAEALGLKITKNWADANNARSESIDRKQANTQNWRDLAPQGVQGLWENSSDFNIPITLIYGKAIHARLWQLFSDLSNFFGVKARQPAFENKELQIKEFMQFVLESYSNNKTGVKEVFDEWLWETVFDGSGYLKLYFQRDVHQYLEVVPVTEVTETTVFDQNNATGRVEINTTAKEREEVREEVVETPQIRRVSSEDITLPIGQGDPQTALWVQHRVFMTDDPQIGRGPEGSRCRREVRPRCHQGSARAQGVCG